jgi:hypothetical protein
VLGQRAADPNLQVVGMRTERQDIDGVDLIHHLVQPNTSSALSGSP